MNKWTIQSILGASIALALAADASATGCAIGVGGGSSSENYGVEIDVVGAGGGDSSSPNFSIRGTLGQVVQNVGSSSPSYSDGSGMWDVLIAAEGEDPVYDPVGCRGEVQVASLADYQAYVADDYGRGGGNRYKHLRVVSSLSDTTVALLSPCRIHIEQGLSLQGDIVLVDARRRVRFGNLVSIQAGQTCIESAEREVRLGEGTAVLSDELTVQSRLGTHIARAFDVDVSGAVKLGSGEGPVEIDRDLTIHAGDVQVAARRAVIVGDDAYVESQDGVALVSNSGLHWTLLGADATLLGDTIRLSAAGLTVVGDDSQLDAAASITIESTGVGPLGMAAVQPGASLSAGTDIAIAGKRRIYIGAGTTVIATDTLHVDAWQSSWLYCLIHPTASFTYAAVTGACAPFAP